MIHAIRNRLGGDLGLENCYSNMPEDKIVDNARDRFASLSSRIDLLKGGPTAAIMAANPIWLDILQEVDSMTKRYPAIINDAIAAAAFSDEVLELEEEVDHLVVTVERTPDEL